MEQVVVGIVAVLVGALLCLRGYAAMRSAIGLLGAFVGFVLGADVAVAVTGGAFLHGVVGWLAGLVGALVLGALAYLSYQVAVVGGIGVMGYGLGVSLAQAMGWSTGRPTVLTGVVLAVLLAALAVVGNLPAVLLVAVTALAGAELVVQGVRSVVGTGMTAGLGLPAGERAAGWWSAVVVVLAAVGALVQLRALPGNRAGVREHWSGAPPAR